MKGPVFGYICECREDYLALVSIQEELMLRPAKTEAEEEENGARFAEVDDLLTQWERKQSCQHA